MNTHLKFSISFTLFIFFVFFLNIEKITAQIEVTLMYQNYFEEKLPTINIPKKIQSISELNILTTNLLQNLHNEGYWNAKLIPFHGIKNSDSLNQNKPNPRNKIKLTIDLGKQVFWTKLNTNSIPILIQKNIISDFERKDFLKEFSKQNSNYPVKTQDIKKLQQAILKYAENNGYPMARTTLDSAEIIETQTRLYFSANLTYQSGSLIQFDSLIIDGNAKIKKDFLMNYLHIQKGKIYQENNVKNAVQLLKTMPYLKLKGKPKVEFRYDRAYLRLPLKKVKSSQFDGVIGFLPKSEAGVSSQNESGSGLLLTGQVKLNLVNPFGAGKTIAFEWQRIRPASQTLYVNYQHPNFLKTNLEIGGNFNFIKEDSTFSIVERRANIAYPSAKFGKIGFFTSLLTTTRTGIIENTDTANIPTADSRFWHYGISHSYNTLDDIYFPRKGFQISTEISTGNKTFTDSLSRTLISDTQTESDFSSPQLKFNTDANFYIKVSKLSSLRLRTQIQFIESKNLFLNELLRVGGLQNLRGFDPNSFFVSRYGLLGAEWRFYFEENSYLMAFAEQAAIRAHTLRNEIYLDLPTSAGAGISFATKTGVFYFIYAMGKSKTQAISVVNSKIHFGLISHF
ncbi:outer membrane protein/protective antigen OMA87 [Bernardetia litoralis DSM 6794]|uniref:Outer membrane protein/protective antigen OMA87 n=1 Tax=Bernardetia litoralis (strain ATCC 23117 / DSM 6794 / NBRC 15988 / NCIMB 1366 / Fx l1 / Sio-4) TaxID=880071 RepID=I4AJ86_BERLS|nr:BamA/TamA family outer membrane protein [Bernardetia litoralis]AFM04021.1 outer membrane protein/protective antigen OMA87 [Bernardetia litoralis DSM 6794]